MNTPRKENNDLDWVNVVNFSKAITVLWSITLLIAWWIRYTPTMLNHLDNILVMISTKNLSNKILEAQSEWIDTSECKVFLKIENGKGISVSTNVLGDEMHIYRESERIDGRGNMILDVLDNDLDGKPDYLLWRIVTIDPDTGLKFNWVIDNGYGWYITLMKWTEEYKVQESNWKESLPKLHEIDFSKCNKAVDMH